MLAIGVTLLDEPLERAVMDFRYERSLVDPNLMQALIAGPQLDYSTLGTSMGGYQAHTGSRVSVYVELRVCGLLSAQWAGARTCHLGPDRRALPSAP